MLAEDAKLVKSAGEGTATVLVLLNLEADVGCGENWPRMIGVRVEIRRYVDDDQPGWVECAFTDAHGREWLFVEKVPVVTSANLDASIRYPRPGLIGCEVIARGEGAGSQDVFVVDTSRPWGIEATTGETQFEVRADQLQEFDPHSFAALRPESA